MNIQELKKTSSEELITKAESLKIENPNTLRKAVASSTFQDFGWLGPADKQGTGLKQWSGLKQCREDTSDCRIPKTACKIEL